jgi:hypothetical protein
MSKRTDFPKKRRELGRALNAIDRELAGLLGLETKWREASAREGGERRLLAQRLKESVVPLYIHRGRVPEGIGSCVLVRLDSDLYAFTAAHVLRDAGDAQLFAPPEGKGGKLRPLPRYTEHLCSSGNRNDLDVAVLVLPASELGPFQQRVFLVGAEIDQDDRPDDQAGESFYFVVGYPASRTQIKVSGLHIDQRLFQFATHPVLDAAEYEHERLPQADHLLLDFDHNEISAGGNRLTPPKLQGASGGGIFHITKKTKQGPLVAIATQNRRHSTLIVGTRIKHFLAMAHELKTRPGSAE